MAEVPKFLTKMPMSPSVSLILEDYVTALPNSLCPLAGARINDLVVPENVACFQRSRASELNLPSHGRTLHHRFVLLAALRSSVTVCVDDREVVLNAGEGLLIFPFQFHHYLQPEQEDILWLIVTFEYAEVGELEPLRFRPFPLNASLRDLLTELLLVYARPNEPKLVVLLLAVLLTRLRTVKPIRQRRNTRALPSMVTQVNVLAESSPEHFVVKQLARKLGISPSHLRTRFIASCGVSLGRHLRRLRLEKACGLLRLSTTRVSEIAEACKFNSIYSFSRAFQTAYGMSPLAYRKAALNGHARNGTRR